MRVANCTHPTTEFIPTPEMQHHGKDVCAACGRFVRWVKKPENIERDIETKRRILELRGKGFLSQWEKSFIESIYAQSKLSPKQREWLNKIWEQYSNV